MARKKKVEEIPRIRLVRPAAYVEVASRGEHGGFVRLFADGRVEVLDGYDARDPWVSGRSCPPKVTTADLREGLALLDALEQVS